jgi:arsenate reductase
MRIYHNPNCGTSRSVLAAIREAGIEPEVFEYLKTPPDREHLTALFAKLGLKPREVLRRKGTTLETLGMDEAKMSDAAILDAMVQHPILLERPIVVDGDDARICRPADRIKKFLNAEKSSPQAD